MPGKAASIYKATKHVVFNRGIPPDRFLDELVAWGRTAPAEIFLPNAGYDVYGSVFHALGPYQGPGHRRAVMLEVMRVLAGYESSWNWNEGRDMNNSKSIYPNTIEAGPWQVSMDSMGNGQDLKDLVAAKEGAVDGNGFQRAMKQNHSLSMEYIARLLRHTVLHNGPVKRHKIDQWLRRDAVAEFMNLLYPASSMPLRNL